MAVDSNRLLENYLNRVPDLEASIVADTEDPAERTLLLEVFTGSATSEAAITDLSQGLIEWAADITDDRLVILVFCAAICTMNTDRAPSVAQTLLGMAKSKLGDDPDPRLLALYHFADALIDRDGNAPNHFEVVLASGLKLLDPGLPLWRDKFNLFALHLAYRGRLKEVEHLLPGLEETGLEGIGRAELDTSTAIVALFDCAETCRLDPFADLVQDLGRRNDIPAETEELIAGYEGQLLLARQLLGDQTLELPPEIAEDAQCQLLCELAHGNARSLHRRIEALDYTDCLIPSTLFGYNALRLSLALRDQDLARDLLIQRREAGLDHYLDDLILARIAMLDGDAGKAADHFANALRAAEYYDAHGRLEFELHLADELSPIQTAWLGHRIDLSRSYAPPPNAFTQAGRERTPLATFQGHTLTTGDGGQARIHFERHVAIDAPCLIYGPSGCGHHALASQLHRDSARHDQDCLSVSCPATGDRDLQPLLFGAPTGEPGLLDQVAGGTLIIHHLEEASPRMQAGIEQLLVHGRYRGTDGLLHELDVKVICTACCISPLALRSSLRPDLWTRLQILPIGLPPLADLSSSLDELITVVLRDIAQRSNLHIDVEPSLRDALAAYAWPGNLDELHALLGALFHRHPQRNRFGLDDLPEPWTGLLHPGTGDHA